MLHKKQIIQHKFYTKCNQLPLKDFQGKRKVIRELGNKLLEKWERKGNSKASIKRSVLEERMKTFVLFIYSIFI